MRAHQRSSVWQPAIPLAAAALLCAARPVGAEQPDADAVIDAVIAKTVGAVAPKAVEPPVLVAAPAPSRGVGADGGQAPLTRRGLGAGAPVFPEGIEYSVQISRLIQQVSNPYRLPDTAGDRRHGDLAVGDEVRAAAIIPLASERTRLLASAAFGNVDYRDQGQLDHHPHAFKTTLQWRAGDLLQGSASVSDRVRLNRYMASSWPERDLLKQRVFNADIGLRVTESLTLPILSVSRTSSRNEFALNQQLYNRDDSQVQIAAHLMGRDNSYVMAGVSRVRSSYPDRTPLQIQQLDRAYTDTEFFLNSIYHYSARTALEGYAGWRQRRYATLTDRNVDFVTAELRGYWDYSAKTAFHVHLWHRPFGNEEDPSTLYSTLTGGRVSMRWQAGEKTWLSLNVVRERQKNYRIGAGGTSETMSWRVGPRLEWQVNPRVLLTLDGWRERVSGAGYPGYGGTVVRAGITLMYDNGSPRPSRLYMREECDAPRYLDTRLCDQ
ncbi:hypothetical protein N5K27_22720 [Pigmentiphaga sp. GD03639]|uniref:hypothetical protein n=1 Tax=unclassified Pigmentiphaga TaxID=2626614 RepID=UPI000B416616|nr:MULTISPECIES: hypothetical protein [unclassified Pigmentiphaga]MDH2239127.1 hypothetical protein [Pigmentiphaga sp. GD03639]OVZ62387.1 hypothetical protein CDO46_17345 [Pigmentiphaga sp. NML030171]